MHRLAPLSIEWNFRVRNYAGNSLPLRGLEINLKLLGKGGGGLKRKIQRARHLPSPGVCFVKREREERVAKLNPPTRLS